MFIFPSSFSITRNPPRLRVRPLCLVSIFFHLPLFCPRVSSFLAAPPPFFSFSASTVSCTPMTPPSFSFQSLICCDLPPFQEDQRPQGFFAFFFFNLVRTHFLSLEPSRSFTPIFGFSPSHSARSYFSLEKLEISSPLTYYPTPPGPDSTLPPFVIWISLGHPLPALLETLLFSFPFLNIFLPLKTWE